MFESIHKRAYPGINFPALFGAWIVFYDELGKMVGENIFHPKEFHRKFLIFLFDFFHSWKESFVLFVRRSERFGKELNGELLDFGKE